MRALLVLVFAFALAAPGRARQHEVPDLEPRRRAALEDLERRNPRMAQRLTRALRWRPEDVRRRLDDHARFLDELDDARARDPERLRAMEEQQEMALQARELALRYHTAKGEAERVAAEAELRAHLNRWFDLRQASRAARMQTLERELAAHRERLADDGDGPLGTWLERIVDGGEPAMRRRLEEPDEDELEVLAPAIVERIGRFEPELGEQLGRLAETDPERFREVLEDVARRHPEVLELARRDREPELELHRRLRRAIRDAHRALIPLVRERRALGLPGLPEPARAKLRAVWLAERGLSDKHLERATAELERQRALLAERELKKDLIVEIQLGKMVGRDVYGW